MPRAEFSCTSQLSSTVAYPGYGRHGRCHGRHFDGGAKMSRQKLKSVFTVSWTSSILRLIHHKLQSCINTAPLPYALLFRRVVPAPPWIKKKLWHCGISQRWDIVTEQERSHAITTRPRPSHAINRGVVGRERVGTAFPNFFQVLF